MMPFSSARSSSEPVRGDALVVHDVELGFGEGRRDFVLHDFDLGAVADDDAVGLLDLADAADVDADAGVEFQRLAAGRRLGIAEHHADLFANLVGENADRARLGNERGELAHRGAHQPGLRADGGVADLAFEFRLGHERGDGIEDDDVERIRADERLARCAALPRRELGWETSRSSRFTPSFFAYCGSSACSTSMNAASPPRFCAWAMTRERERRFARGFRAEDLDDAAARKAAARRARGR